MEINTEISGSSWAKITDQEANHYLHGYPKEAKVELSNYISLKKINPTVLDLGCGNAQLYTILKDQNPTMIYQGVDIADPLINVARNIVGGGGSIIKDDIFNYLSNNRDQYDFLVLCHMVECNESIEFLISKSLERCENLAILWFDYPKYEFDSVFINNNPHSGSSTDFRPYIRRKIGKDYWKSIIDRNDMNLIHRKAFGENNILEIFSKKS